MSRSPRNYPESVAIWKNKGGGIQRIPSPWVYRDDDDEGIWKCYACGGKEMCESHAMSRDHARKVWYYCFGYGKHQGPGKLMNAVESSVRHNNNFVYPGRGPGGAASMLEPQGGDDHRGAQAAAAAEEVPSGSRWAAAAAAAGQQGAGEAEVTLVESFKMDSNSNSSQIELGPSIDQKLDGVIALTSTMGQIMDKATKLIEKIDGSAADQKGPTAEAKIDEVKQSFESALQTLEAKIGE
ncbi:unnamed protein product, partial [Prorocentrum cordatum]